jgi:hypothetical protein
MSYVRPEEVLSPKHSVKQVIEVIHDPGEPDTMCVARILWRGEERIAMRWNGSNKQPKGNPTSHGQPTWFVLEKDDPIEAEVERAARKAAEECPNSLVTQYRDMANDAEREKDAKEWSEGLIADGNTQR